MKLLLKNPIRDEGLEKALKSARRPGRWSGLAASVPTIGFNFESIITASLGLDKCFRTRGTMSECSVHEIRDHAVGITFDVADVVATLATIPFLWPGIIADVALMVGEMAYNIWSALHRYISQFF